MLLAIGIVIGLVVGGAAVALALVGFRGSRMAAARRTRQLLLAEARREAEALRREAQIEAREESVKLRAEIESDLHGRRAAVAASEERARSLEAEVERVLERRFGFPIVVVVRSHAQLRSVVERAPAGFGAEPTRYHSDAIFLRAPLAPKQVMAITKLREKGIV